MPSVLIFNKPGVLQLALELHPLLLKDVGDTFDHILLLAGMSRTLLTHAKLTAQIQPKVKLSLKMFGTRSAESPSPGWTRTQQTLQNESEFRATEPDAKSNLHQ